MCIRDRFDAVRTLRLQPVVRLGVGDHLEYDFRRQMSVLVDHAYNADHFLNSDFEQWGVPAAAEIPAHEGIDLIDEQDP